MAVVKERYQFAEQLYVLTEKSIEEIAQITGIPRRLFFVTQVTLRKTRASGRE